MLIPWCVLNIFLETRIQQLYWTNTEKKNTFFVVDQVVVFVPNFHRNALKLFFNQEFKVEKSIFVDNTHMYNVYHDIQINMTFKYRSINVCFLSHDI